MSTCESISRWKMKKMISLKRVERTPVSHFNCDSKISLYSKDVKSTWIFRIRTTYKHNSFVKNYTFFPFGDEFSEFIFRHSDVQLRFCQLNRIFNPSFIFAHWRSISKANFNTNGFVVLFNKIFINCKFPTLIYFAADETVFRFGLFFYCDFIFINSFSAIDIDIFFYVFTATYFSINLLEKLSAAAIFTLEEFIHTRILKLLVGKTISWKHVCEYNRRYN